MNFTPSKTPLIVKKMFPNYIWDLPNSNKEVYLTFDDGPTPDITNWTLDILKQHNAKATFFCVGDNIKKYPEIFQNIKNQGHSLGNHTYNHMKGWKNSTPTYLNNIEKASKLISTKLFRPPYGQITPKQGKELIKLGYHIVMWNVLSIDWDSSISKETCLNNIISHTQSGSIVVFHDSEKASKNMQYTLPKVLEHFSNKGYVFKSIRI